MKKVSQNKIAKASKYVYKSLDEFEAGSQDTCDFYATILDATFPHKVANGAFSCTLKIADQSCKLIDGTTEIQTCTLVFWGKDFKDLPICSRMGDIIRVHRATVSILIRNDMC